MAGVCQTVPGRFAVLAVSKMPPIEGVPIESTPLADAPLVAAAVLTGAIVQVRTG